MERKLLYRKKLSMAVAVLLLVAAFALVGLMKVELMPAIDEGTVSVEATFRSGTKVSEVDARMQELEAMVAAHPDVESYTLTSSKGSGSISVNLKDKRKMSSQEVADQWMEETKDMTGIQLDITVSSQMSSMMATGSGASVTLSSTNLDDLKEAAALVEENAWDIPGVLNVSSDAGRECHADQSAHRSVAGHGPRHDTGTGSWRALQHDQRNRSHENHIQRRRI